MVFGKRQPNFFYYKLTTRVRGFWPKRLNDRNQIFIMEPRAGCIPGLWNIQNQNPTEYLHACWLNQIKAGSHRPYFPLETNFLPPVAMQSSITKTFSLGFMTDGKNWSASTAYCKVYSTCATLSSGSLPGFLNIKQPMPNFLATSGPQMKPLLCGIPILVASLCQPLFLISKQIISTYWGLSMSE